MTGNFLLFIKVCVSDDIMTFCWNLLLLGLGEPASPEEK